MEDAVGVAAMSGDFNSCFGEFIGALHREGIGMDIGAQRAGVHGDFDLPRFDLPECPVSMFVG